MKSRSIAVGMSALAAMLVTSPLHAVELQNPTGGTAASPTAKANSPKLNLTGGISPSGKYYHAQYATASVGLRNRGAGGIVISGAVKPVKAAFLYWAVITQGPPPSVAKSMNIQRISLPTSTAVNLTGTLVGSGGQPCWAGDTISVFRARVPLSIAQGNGLYKVSIKKGAGGSTGGEDPWIPLIPILPLQEGASLVIIGTGSGTVGVYDTGSAGNTSFGGGFTYQLKLPVAAPGNSTLLDNIGADGQSGASRTPSNLANETTAINGIQIAGPGSVANDSDWNGNAALPVPQLWDDTGHDITTATPPGTRTLDVSVVAHGDCLTPVANVVSVE